MNDLVTIVIPVYKVEDVILNTLVSINQQTYRNIEAVIVDDGTPDRSAIIAEEYLQTTQMNWRIIHKKNAGLAAARNTGIEAAKGDWVFCLDSDDTIEPNALEEMLSFAHNNTIDCVFCGYKSVTLDNVNQYRKEKANGRVYSAGELRNLFLGRTIKLLATGMLVRKSVYQQIRFDSECPYDEDIHFLWKLLYTYNKFGLVSNAYYHYLNRNTSMVHTLKAQNYLKASQCYAELEAELLKAYPDDRDMILKIYPKYRLGGAHVLAKANDYKTFQKTIIQDGYRRGMWRLILQPNLKLSLYSLLYCCSLSLFYYISR